jgi:hypothetical protein
MMFIVVNERSTRRKKNKLLLAKHPEFIIYHFLDFKPTKKDKLTNMHTHRSF